MSLHSKRRSRSARPAGASPTQIALDAPLGADPNHHLWRNGRFWWIAYTAIIDGWRPERIRHSLKTDDLSAARVRRDEILATVSSEGVLRRVS